MVAGMSATTIKFQAGIPSERGRSRKVTVFIAGPFYDAVVGTAPTYILSVTAKFHGLT